MFYYQLISKILENIDNNHKDNYDYYRFGPIPKKKINVITKFFIFCKRVKDFLIWKLKIPYKYHHETYLYPSSYIKSLEILAPFIEKIEKNYDSLEDAYSKELLVILVAYRILFRDKIKLPLNTPKYWNDILEFKNYKTNEFISVPFVEGKNINLYKYKIPINNTYLCLYSEPMSLNININIIQYENNYVKINTGDIVLDCGTCWGDTTLFFAEKVGEQGHVYGFDFIPSNINTCKLNISLNSHLEKRITLVEQPISKTSDEVLFYSDNGPGSFVSTEPISANSVKSISIDDFMMKYSVPKVDFIKMDIEGAELPALEGAINTILTHRPKLAISIYHNLNDFANIPQFILNLPIDYKIYLNHATIHSEETVILAIPLDKI